MSNSFISRDLFKLIISLFVINITFDILFVIESFRFPIAILRAIVISFVAIIVLAKAPKDFFNTSKPILYLLFYFTLLIIFGSDISISFPIYLKFFLSLIMFPIFYVAIDSFIKFRKLIKNIFYVAVLFVLNFIVSLYFDLGKTAYGGDVGFYSGNLLANALYPAALCIITYPLFLELKIFKNYNWFITIIMSLLLIFIVLSFRRTAILAILIGLSAFFVFLRKKGVVLKLIFALSIFLLLSYPLYGPTFEERFMARAERFEEGALLTEGRFVETQIIWTNISSFYDISYSLFGRELFNSAGNYGYPDYRRLIHVDYNIIVSGSGLVGLVLYLYFYVFIFKKLLFYHKIFKYNKKLNFIVASALGVYFMSLGVSFSSGLFAVTYRIMVFAYLGGVLGFLSSRLITPTSFKNMLEI